MVHDSPAYLSAGARRLEATKRLGATMIEVRRVGDLTEQERTIIELERTYTATIRRRSNAVKRPSLP